VLAALEREPASADAWGLLGTLDARAGDLAAARRHLQRALAIDPAQHDARTNLARLPP
jgi:Flp pilus assembly protein TadD